MDQLWAPWRETYITKVIRNQHQGCVFCRMLNDKDDAKNFIFLKGKYTFAVLNIYPYSNGHCLILPYRHVSDISKMPKAATYEMMDLLIETKYRLTKAVDAQGFNIGFNLGRIAGAGIPGHVHMHVVPRWRGDHNFMPVTGKTKIISQSLVNIYKLLIKPCATAKTSKN